MQHGKAKVTSLRFESRGIGARFLSLFWGHRGLAHAQDTRARWAQDRVVGAATCHAVLGVASGTPASRPMRVALKGHRSKFGMGVRAWLALAAMHNWSAHTDPQQQEAASPQMLWSGGLRR